MGSGKRRIAIVGAGFVGGNLGRWLCDAGHHVQFLSVDVRERTLLRRAICAARADVVINAAGKTDIDWCEQNPVEAFAVNALGAENVAAAAAEARAPLVHLSSGCVQTSRDGTPLKEDTPAAPQCHYTRTKVSAEARVRRVVHVTGLQALVLRPRLILSAVPSARNTLVKLLTYTSFIDTANSCTVLEDLAIALQILLERKATGVVNVVNPGITSPLRLAASLGVRGCLISKVALDRMTLARRADAVLSDSKLRSFGVRLVPIEARLPMLVSALRDSLRTPVGASELARAVAETSRKLALARQVGVGGPLDAHACADAA